MPKKKLGVLLSTPQSSPNVATVTDLCEEGIKSGVDVYLYLIDEGVGNLHDPRFRALAASGMKLFVCAYGCQQHGVSTETIDETVTLCGLVVLSQIINGCDRFLAFT